MRGQNQSSLNGGLRALLGALLSSSFVLLAGAIYAQSAPEIVPRVTGAAPPMTTIS